MRKPCSGEQGFAYFDDRASRSANARENGAGDLTKVTWTPVRKIAELFARDQLGWKIDFRAAQGKDKRKWAGIAGSIRTVEENECALAGVVELERGLPRSRVPPSILCSHDLDGPAPVAQHPGRLF
jgi:hypothetical protein